RMVDRKEPICAKILQMRLADIGANAGPVEIAALTDGVPWQSNLSAEIKMLKDVSTRRGIIRCVVGWGLEAQANDTNVQTLAAAIANRAADFNRNTAPNTGPFSINWGEVCVMTFQAREALLHEVERGEIVMCPAISGRGKTTLWRNVALSLA